MWIKWKYNDHGWRDWAEIEIPDDFDGWESVEDYLISRDDLHIPTWSERYMLSRLHWEKLELSPEETKTRLIKKLKDRIAYHKRYLAQAQKDLAKAKS